METKPINSFRPAPYNPRVLDTHDAESLDRSINRWNDVSGITANVQTNNLVTGHQRVGILRGKFGDERVKILITERLAEPDEYHTVARGYVVVEGTNIKLAYREISVSPEEEKAINVAANRVSGRFDIDLLTELNKELAQLENAADLLEATGQTEDEVKNMLNQVNELDKLDQSQQDSDSLSFKVTTEQREVIDEAINHVRATREMATDQQSSMNGNALYYICRDYLDRLHGLIDTPQEQSNEPTA